jgi:peptidoglycan hydrolase-like protein with peptidoglycan-binding domain
MASKAPSMSPSGTASRSSASAAPDEIKQAQEALQTQGLYHGQLDGKWGPETRQAVAQFQKAKGLQQTAQLDPQTMNDLQSGAMSGSDNMSNAPNASAPVSPTGDAIRGNGPAASGSNPGGENGPAMGH